MIVVLLALGCGSAGAPRRPTGPGTAPTDSGPDLPDDRVEAFRVLADRADFEVRDGRFGFLDPNDCCREGWNCLWNNPSTPYGLYALPPLPGQTGADTMLDDGGWGRSFHLREDEVVVLLGPTPPPSAYFSLRSYLSWRPSERPIQLVIGSLGASLNHLVVAEQVGGDPFDRPVAVVTSADAVLEGEVRDLLVRAGWATEDVLLDRMVHAEARFGLDDLADQFMVVTRTAVIEDPARDEAWYADPGATLLRLSPRVVRPITSPHRRPELPDRGAGTDETAWAEALAALGEAIRARYAPRGMVEEVAVHHWFETLDCIDQGHCSGDIRDRYYARVPNFALPDADTFVVVYGVNHARTGKVSYSNFAVDTVKQAIGITAVDSRDMVGSAREYLPDHPLADDLYAWVVARDCAARPEPRCVEVPTECPGVPLEDPMLISFRAYLEPSTGAAPVEPELVADRAILVLPEGFGPPP